MEPLSLWVDAFRAEVNVQGDQAACRDLRARCGFAFVKRPLAAAGGLAAACGFSTPHIDVSDIQALGPLASKWLLFPLEKREGNAFLGRLSVGRATNCDVVLRFVFVSKLQGHVTLEGDTPTSYIDYGGPNPARLNGVPVAAKETRTLAAGDLLAIGPLTLELVAPDALAALIVSMASERA